ncbi:hypothetical protein CL620_01895 [archaeon]|nr:hypothetical protein [archaeon]
MDIQNHIKGKTVLITGGTGFLGRHLVKEFLKYNPQSIRVFSRDEVKHHHVQEQFMDDPRLRYLLGDIRDYKRLLRAMNGVDLVIHAAALKRIDMMEYNVEECINTNVNGVLNVVHACLERDVPKAIFVSTDKACSPINTYGASKFIGERIFTESNYSKGTKKTVFTAVRYGNVLESTGSVIPFFESKIKSNDPIPLTDARMTRFIISPQQAVELILDAIKYGIGGEVFVPKLPAFKIVDLIQILKGKHNANTGVKVIGIRPGEKIHELMINESEVPRTFSFRNRYVITSSIQQYQQNLLKPLYQQEGRLLTHQDMNEYGSYSEVRPQQEIKELFEEFQLL